MLFRSAGSSSSILFSLDAEESGSAAKERKGAVMWICSWSGVDFVRARCESRGGLGRARVHRLGVVAAAFLVLVRAMRS